LSVWLFIKLLLGLTRQHRTTGYGVLIQLSFVVILVIAQNLKAVVNIVIVWQLYSLPRSAMEQTNSDQKHCGQKT